MDEKKMILKMLEEGKINAEEALKLMESIEKTSSSSTKSSKYNNADQNKLNDAINKLSKKAEKIADKIGPDFLNKVENVSNDFADATVKFADKIINYVNTGFNNSDIHKTITKDYSFPLEKDEIVNVNVKTQNLSVICHNTDDSKVFMILKLKCLFDNNDEEKLISSKFENGNIIFQTDFPLRTWGTLEVYLPNNVNIMDIQTSNSKCYIENFKGNSLKCVTSNGNIDINSCGIDILNTTTSNGRINIIDTSATITEAITSNSNIEIKNSIFDKMKSYTSNGSIYLNQFDAINDVEAFYTLHTSNGKILIELPNKKSFSCKIKAKTSLGKINVSKLDSSYTIEKGERNLNSEAVIVSNEYDSFSKRVNIEASTSNSSVNIIGN